MDERDTQVLSDEDIKTEWRRSGAPGTATALADPDSTDTDGTDSDSTDTTDTTDTDSKDSDSDSTDS